MPDSPIHEETDDDLRNNSTMEGSTAMTIEFLRSRLLAERSVSRAARQRADELAKRVAELEDQLKIVSLQRKKAEKATVDVLAILESHGMNEFSDEFDSSSDQEVDQCKSEVSNDFREGNVSAGLKMRIKHGDESSTSEHESYPSLGRSLSWKSGKQSPHSHEKKYVDSSASRRRSFASSKSESSRLQVGRSCRRIQRKETRLGVEDEEKNDNSKNDPQEGGVTSSEGYSTHSDTGSQILGGNCTKPVVEVKENPASGGLENQREAACAVNYLHKDGSCEKMEMAIERQARLIGQYQEEEKAQREWEEKFRENENSSPDSVEPGNQSDVTEERDETKVHAAPFSVGNISASTDPKEKPAMEDTSKIKESSKSQPNGFLPPQRSDVEGLPENRSPTTDPSDINRAQEIQHSRNLSFSPSPHSNNGYHLGDASPRKTENFALVPHEAPHELGSILDALQKAKLSLKQKINDVPSVEDRAIGKSLGVKPEDPVGFRGLFSVPYDFHFEPNSYDSNPRLSLTQYYPNGGHAPSAADRSFSRPYSEASSSFYGSERNYSTPNSPYRESTTRVPTWEPLEARSRTSRQPFSDPGFDAGSPYSGRYEFNDPSMVGGRSYSSPYASPPAYPGSVPRIPSNEGPPRFPSSRNGMLPSSQFLYDEPGRPRTYR